MKRWLGPALLALAGILFIVLNHASFHGYFQDDELDTLSWAPHTPAAVWIRGLLSPFFLRNNFRPVGHLYFLALGRTAGLRFPPYLAVLQLLHLANALLVYFLARYLRLPPVFSAFAAAFFALSAAALDAYWKPMYVFDVLCAGFCLASLLLYLHHRWIWSFAAFWLAYKSKEPAIMLPAVLLAYEWTLGERQWKRLVPFFAVSLSFGLQGLVFNPNRNNAYSFHFTGRALAATARFYSSRLLLVPFGALLLIPLALFRRDRRLGFALAIAFLFLVPLLALPGRLFPAYVYLPEVGVALAVAIAFSAVHPSWSLLFFAVWIPWNIRELRLDRRTTLAAAEQVRPYVTAIVQYARLHPDPPPIVFDNRPENFGPWGVTAAANLAWHRSGMELHWRGSADGRKALEKRNVLFMIFDPPSQTMHFLERHPDTATLGYLHMNLVTPPWQLTSGFARAEGDRRWIEGHAEASLRAPEAAQRFEVVAHRSPGQLPVTLTLHLDELLLGAHTFLRPGKERVLFDIPPHAFARNVTVRFDADRTIRPPGYDQELALALMGFGFVASRKTP